jgi:DNA adenine methylase
MISKTDRNQPAIKSPFPYFGGKSRVAHLVWDRFGVVPNYVEPFAGSLAVLLARPTPFIGNETVNDSDCMIVNFWRALQDNPETVAHYADWPVFENDIHSRHIWLVNRKESLQSRLEGDPDFFDVKIAGWWVWGICSWIGSDWCIGQGPWNITDQAGVPQLVRSDHKGTGVRRKIVYLYYSGSGVHRRIKPGEPGTCLEWSAHLKSMMQLLADRLRQVRVCCGDWSRICGPSPTYKQGLTAIFLDPPYPDTAERESTIYTHDSLTVAHEVQTWAIENGDNPLLRIALCGYEGQHTMPAEWECVTWKAKGGYASQRQKGVNHNSQRERIWFSPHCLKPDKDRMPLFAGLDED